MRMSGGMFFFSRTGTNKLASLTRFRSQPAWNQFWISSFAGFRSPERQCIVLHRRVAQSQAQWIQRLLEEAEGLRTHCRIAPG